MKFRVSKLLQDLHLNKIKILIILIRISCISFSILIIFIINFNSINPQEPNKKTSI